MLRFQGEEYRAPSSLHTNRKSLKRTLYSLPKTTLILPYTPLHDVNVTSISTTQELTTLIFYILANLRFDLLLEKGE